MYVYVYIYMYVHVDNRYYIYIRSITQPELGLFMEYESQLHPNFRWTISQLIQGRC